jgi:charged multivesicular body protein 6
MGCESSNEKRHQKTNQVKKKEVSLSETEQAILQCKTCRDKIKKYIRNLEQKEEKLREKAKDLLRHKKRDRAKYYLKQCRLFREQAKIADGQLEMINNQIINIESTCNMQECMSCINQGNAVLKNLQKDVNLEEWENIRDDLEELKEKDREINDFFRERGIDGEECDAQCEDELNKLLYEIQGDKQINLPEVPKTKIKEDEIPTKKDKVKVKSKKKLVNA